MLVKFSRLWEECSQEEAQIANREENMGSEDQALTVQSKKSRSSHHRSNYSHHRNNSRKTRDRSKYIAIHVIKKDTLLEIVLRTKVILPRRREAKEDNMLMLQRMMNHPRRDPYMKVKILQVRMNMF